MIKITDLNLTEQRKFAELLKSYFPWLGIDSENYDDEISGADTIQELDNLYAALPQVLNPGDTDPSDCLDHWHEQTELENYEELKDK